MSVGGSRGGLGRRRTSIKHDLARAPGIVWGLDSLVGWLVEVVGRRTTAVLMSVAGGKGVRLVRQYSDLASGPRHGRTSQVGSVASKKAGDGGGVASHRIASGTTSAMAMAHGCRQSITLERSSRAAMRSTVAAAARLPGWL